MKKEALKELSEDEKQSLRKSIENNQKERLEFVDLWARYVLEHDDKEWSRQQNIIINSCLRSSWMTKEDYLNMKGENCRNEKMQDKL